MKDSGDEKQRKMVALGVWLIAFLNTGNIKAAGVLLPSLQNEFHTNTRSIGAAVSLLIVSGSSVAIMFAQPLTRFYSIRSIIISAETLSTIGLILCSIAPNVSVLIFGIFLEGLSNIGFILSFGALSTYFDEYHSLVVSLVTAGLPVAIMVITPVTQFLTELYGWRGAMLLLAAIQFHSVAAGAVLKPVKDIEISETPKINQSILTFQIDVFNIALIKNSSFLIIAFVHALLGYGFNGWLVYLISIGLDKGITFNDSGIVVLISGIGIFITRVLLSLMAFTQWNRRSRHLLYIGSALMTSAYGGMYFTNSFILLSVLSFMLGVGYGICGTELFVAVNTCVAEKDMKGAIAWMILTEGIAYITGGVITGLLFDLTESYNLSLIVLSGMSCLMTIVLGIEDLYKALYMTKGKHI